MRSAVAEREVPSGVSDDKSAEPLVPDQHVCAEPQDEIRNGVLPCGGDRVGQVVGGLRLVQKIRGTTDPERGIWREWLIESDVLSVQLGGDRFQCTGFHR